MMLSLSAKRMGNRILHKMRVLKQAAINAHNLASHINQLRDIIDAGNNSVLQDLKQLQSLTTALHTDTRQLIDKERIRLFHDLDASYKYRIAKLEKMIEEQSVILKQQAFQQPLAIHNNRFILFSHQENDIVIPSEEVGLISYLKRHGPDFIEPGTRKIICQNLAAGDTAVDIGANFGIHAFDMCRSVGANGTVYAFEPTPSMAEALRQSAIISRLRNLHIIEMAVTDKQQITRLYSYGHSPENSMFVYPELENNSNSFDVQSCSLDSFFSPGSRIDLIKIDAEGAEPLIFKGMTRVIAENPQIKIICELSASHFARSGYEFETFVHQIESYGFEILAIDEETGIAARADLIEMQIKGTLNVLLKRTAV